MPAARVGYVIPTFSFFVFALLFVVASVVPSTALARTTRAYEGSFGSFGGEGPRALAVDQSNGDVYVFARLYGDEGSVFRFTSTGTPDDFTAGPSAGTNVLTGFSANGTVAVDSSGGTLNGYIYVTDMADDAVRVFAGDGTSLGTLDGSGTNEGSFGDPCGVAVDQANGDVYVTQGNGKDAFGKIWRYAQGSPSGSIDDADFTVTGVSASRVCDVAADSGNVYTAAKGEGGKLFQDSASSFVTNPAPKNLGTVLDQGPVTAVYADPQNGDVYADEGRRVAVFDSNGVRLYDFGYAAYFGSGSEGIAVKSAASGAATKAYVADSHSGGDQVDVFGLPANVPLLSHPELAVFGKDGTASTTFGFGLDQLAFDQAAGKLFALDKYNSEIYGFDASGPPGYPALSGFAPLATADTGDSPGFAVDNSGLGSAGRVYVASQGTNLLYGFDPAAAALGGGFPIDSAITPGPPNGSPKELCGTAVDSAGNIWIANRSSSRILEYSSSGASLAGSVDTSAQGMPCRLTFDSGDDLYAVVAGKVWRYSAASGYSAATLVDSSNALGIAVNPSDDHLYVAHEKWVDEYDSVGGLVDEFATGIADALFRGVAVEGLNGNLYLADAGNRRIHVLGPGIILPEVAIGSPSGVANTSATLRGSVASQGLALTDCHFEYVSGSAYRAAGFSDLSTGGSVPCTPAAGAIPADVSPHPVSVDIAGLTTSTSYRFRLVAANVNGEQKSSEDEFTTSGQPLVETTGAPTRTPTSAGLGGRVSPRGSSSTYYFQYGEEGPCDANPCAQTPARPAGSGNLTELVSEEIKGLEPNTTYHYRVVADNGNADGAAFGEDMTVTTRASETALSHGRFPGPPGSDRAWEQVSPPETGGHTINEAIAFSADGNRALFSIAGGTPLSETGSPFVPFFAERTASGWQTRKILPPREDKTGSSHWSLFPDVALSNMIASEMNESTTEVAIWRLDAEGPPSKLYQLPGPGAVARLGEVGISDDGSRLVVADGNSVYDLSAGTQEPINVLPDGSFPACSTRVGVGNWISSDGSLIYFASGGEGCGPTPLRVYLRDLEAGVTELISPPPVSGPECDTIFLSSSPGAVFLWSKSRLSADDTEPAHCANEFFDMGHDGDIYRYDLGDRSIKCVTCVVPALDADVQAVYDSGSWRSGSIRIADDGTRVYFQSPNALAPGAPEFEHGSSTYRVNVITGDLAWLGGPEIDLARMGTWMTPDGATLLFRSAAPFLNPLNGTTNAGTDQYYRYDDRDRSLICISCPTDGSAPRGPVGSPGGGQGVSLLSRDGDDVAFATPTPLVKSDQNTSALSAENGADVYEWRDGRPLLVTDGIANATAGTEGPGVSGITADGRDIFFFAPAQYTPDALDGYRRLYDARIGGGFEYPKPPPPCPLEVCQGTPKGVPEEAAPGTSSFSGPLNDKPHKVHRRRHHKRQAHKKHRRQRAPHNGRAAR